MNETVIRQVIVLIKQHATKIYIMITLSMNLSLAYIYLPLLRKKEITNGNRSFRNGFDNGRKR